MADVKTWEQRAQEAGHFEVVRPGQSVDHMLAEIADLRAALQAQQGDALDAERYRWLRSDDIEVLPGQREICVYLERLPFREDQNDELLVESALDAAIDAAMLAARREG